MATTHTHTQKLSQISMKVSRVKSRFNVHDAGVATRAFNWPRERERENDGERPATREARRASRTTKAARPNRSPFDFVSLVYFFSSGVRARVTDEEDEEKNQNLQKKRKNNNKKNDDDEPTVGANRSSGTRARGRSSNKSPVPFFLSALVRYFCLVVSSFKEKKQSQNPK